LKKRPPFDYYYEGIITGSRVILGQAITLVESTLPGDIVIATQLINKVLPLSGKSIRIGITGVPGVGKSTFIDTFGSYVALQGRKLAVLTIDPTSQLTRGSILGDKTRMEALAKNPNAFIRPTASGTVLGGVAHKTREAVLLCEASGYDTIIVETVGIGQSETSVKSMVDFFLLLILAGAGDELQGIKKGIMEMADAIVITKADGDNILPAKRAVAEYQHAMHLFQPTVSGWTPKVLTSSAITKNGIDSCWELMMAYEQQAKSTGYWSSNRQQQQAVWFRESFETLVRRDINQSATLQNFFFSLEQQVINGMFSAQMAAQELLKEYHKTIRGTKS
jgi:LAO/AO transport system kinase